MGQIEQALIFIAAVAIIICFSELASHNFQLRREAQADGDRDTARFLLNQALMAAGIAAAGLWLLLVVFVNDDSQLAQAIFVGLLVAGSLAAVGLYVRIRFRG